jgi:biopolymer transport protein ExbD
MRLKREKPKREPTIALINIVFLMLIFFLVAGTLAQPLDDKLRLVNTRDLETTPPADALVIHQDSSLTYRGNPVSRENEDLENFLTGTGASLKERTRLVPDRNLDATELVKIGRDLRLAGAEKIVIVTERGLE